MDEAHLERRFRNEIDSLRTDVERRLSLLEAPALGTQNLIASPNYLLNSHPEWSTEAWDFANIDFSSVTDLNRECYNWQYQERANSGQDLADVAVGFPVLADGHTDFSTLPANAPIWDRESSRFFIGHETGTSYDIACPLQRDFVFPGHRYYIYFETILLDNTVDLTKDGVKAEFYCGFWDNTGAPATVQQRWIYGNNFLPTFSIYGIGGSRTLTYKVLAATDSGDQILSDDIVVPNAPATMSVDNHVRLFFDGAPGFISFKIYRYDGITYRLVGEVRNSIDLQFFDMQENAGSLETGWPSLTEDRPLAYKSTTGLLAYSTQYVGHTMVIQIPTTYNRAQTANNNQYFRFGLTSPISKVRGLGIRRLMVSEGYGPWVRCQTDLSRPLSSPSASTSSSPVPGGTGSNGPEDGPEPICVTLDTEVEIVESRDGVDVVTSIPISQVERGMLLVSGFSVCPVLKIKTGTAQETYTIRTRRGFELTCTATHRLLKSRFDKYGTAVRTLQIGDKLLTSEEGVLSQDTIEDIVLNVGATEVRTVTLPPPHLFITNGLVSHNDKLPGPVVAVNQA